VTEPRDLLEEYADGLLADDERGAVEAALARDGALRDELERVRRFDALLASVRRDADDERAVRRVLAAVARAQARARLLRLVPAAAVIAAIGFFVGRTASDPPPSPDLAVAESTLADWVVFGKRLGESAAQRRDGLVPRTGVGGLEAPPAKAAGVVFSAALGVLGVRIDPAVEARAHRVIVGHFEEARRRGPDVAGECARAEAALRAYRELRGAAGAAVADAFYDVFRPGLADLDTARRVLDPARLDPVAGSAYVRAYGEALQALERRYGAETVSRVLDRLAPTDARFLRRDAADDGVGRDAVLSIRAEVYRAAVDAGAGKLYVALP